MPAARNGRRQQPVTLRDFLEFGCESSSDGFRSYPRCYPCDALALHLHTTSNNKAAPAPEAVEEELRRSPSWSPSAFLFPNKSQAGSALARISSTLSRSFSRRITTFSFPFSFWSRRRDDDDDYYFDDDRDSCAFFPSPLVSSCSSFSSSSSSSELLLDIVIQEPPVFDETSASATATSSSSEMPGAAGHGHQAQALDAGGDDPAAVGRRKLETMEDKQQLSPVSVLDFPFDDDDGDEEERSDAGTCSPSCFQHNCAANLQRKKQKSQQMVHEIRRFDDDGQTAEEAVVVDLEARFITTITSSLDDLPSNNSTDDSEAADDTSSTASRHEDDDDEEQQMSIERSEEEGQQDHHHETEPDDDDHDEYRLLARLLDGNDKKAAVVAVDEITEWLLLDFFAEGITDRRLRSSVVTAAKPLLHDDDVNNKVMMTAALDWLRGAGPQWGIGDVMFSGESALKDMERGRRWMCAREEEQDVGAEVEAFVMDFLVDELVTQLVAARQRFIVMEL
ncbi:hypothetical protein PR202_gb18375 [Eleusine coracana subsp. coracana]|uniref:DUF4378 domain-containing protein n=1 Tax=Eleusine coracana subsp. coracana TaxID=191504 RepID=A0AAV5F589_ELECO|nr:hypothetical protein QOZ80_3BG0296640 [Eleusine coracana subsp. coracana]GJN30096.1 hypothetical protein PR202_gb18375 [Eleusine coracana subsp. coracana]